MTENPRFLPGSIDGPELEFHFFGEPAALRRRFAPLRPVTDDYGDRWWVMIGGDLVVRAERWLDFCARV